MRVKCGMMMNEGLPGGTEASQNVRFFRPLVRRSQWDVLWEGEGDKPGAGRRRWGARAIPRVRPRFGWGVLAAGRLALRIPAPMKRGLKHVGGDMARREHDRSEYRPR